MVRESWEQFSTAAHWIEGIAETQVIALTAMMMWLLTVQLPAAANLGEFYKHGKHERIDMQACTRTHASAKQSMVGGKWVSYSSQGRAGAPSTEQAEALRVRGFSSS